MNPRKLVLPLFCLALVSVVALKAEPQAPIHLWPGVAPGEKEALAPEADTTKPGDALISGKRVIRTGNVSIPTLTFYPAPKSNNSGATVLVFPGGGYSILALDLEGSEVCEWLNTIGVNAALLKYRVPGRKDQERWKAPLQDAQRAISITRQKASQWSIDPKKIGVLGFSAGGHLAAMASTRSGERFYDAMDEIDKESSRPDFAVLIYPGSLAVKGEGIKLAPEFKINEKTPPTFLALTEDDGGGVFGVMAYYAALAQAKVPATLHLYARGGHGYGLRPSANNVSHWPREVEEWMAETGFLTKPSGTLAK